MTDLRQAADRQPYDSLVIFVSYSVLSAHKLQKFAFIFEFNGLAFRTAEVGSGGAYVLRRLTPSQTAKVQLRKPVVTSEDALDSDRSERSPGACLVGPQSSRQFGPLAFASTRPSARGSLDRRRLGLTRDAPPPAGAQPGADRAVDRCGGTCQSADPALTAMLFS